MKYGKYIIIALSISYSMYAMSHNEEDINHKACDIIIKKYFGDEVYADVIELKPFILEVVKEIRKTDVNSRDHKFLYKIDEGLVSMYCQIDLDNLGSIMIRSINKWAREE